MFYVVMAIWTLVIINLGLSAFSLITRRTPLQAYAWFLRQFNPMTHVERCKSDGYRRAARDSARRTARDTNRATLQGILAQQRPGAAARAPEDAAEGAGDSPGLIRSADTADLAPDLTEPIEAYRGWQVHDDGTLFAVNQQQNWPPGEAAEASCRVGHPHTAPDENCACGFYSATELGDIQTATTDVICWGRVALWGKVIKYTRGYRAQYAYPLALTIYDARPGASVKQTEQLACLIEHKYGIVVEIATKEQWREMLNAPGRTSALLQTGYGSITMSGTTTTSTPNTLWTTMSTITSSSPPPVPLSNLNCRCGARLMQPNPNLLVCGSCGNQLPSPLAASRQSTVHYCCPRCAGVMSRHTGFSDTLRCQKCSWMIAPSASYQQSVAAYKQAQAQQQKLNQLAAQAAKLKAQREAIRASIKIPKPGEMAQELGLALPDPDLE